MPSARVVNQSGCSLDPRVVRRGLQREVEGDLEAELAGARRRRRRSPRSVPRSGWIASWPPSCGADRPRRAGVVGPGGQGVVRALAVGRADRVDRRQVEHVEAHRGDGGQPLRRRAEGPGRRSCRPSGRRPRPRSAGRTRTRSRRALARGRRERDRPRAGDQLAQRVALETSRTSAARPRREPGLRRVRPCRAARRRRRSRTRRPCAAAPAAPAAARSNSRAPSSIISSTSMPAGQLDLGGVLPGARAGRSTPRPGRSSRPRCVGRDLGRPAVGLGPDGCIRVNGRLPPRPGREHDVGGDRVVALAEDGRADREGLPDDRLGGPASAVHERGDVADRDAAEHRPRHRPRHRRDRTRVPATRGDASQEIAALRREVNTPEPPDRPPDPLGSPPVTRDPSVHRPHRPARAARPARGARGQPALVMARPDA